MGERGCAPRSNARIRKSPQVAPPHCPEGFSDTTASSTLCLVRTKRKRQRQRRIVGDLQGEHRILIGEVLEFNLDFTHDHRATEAKRRRGDVPLLTRLHVACALWQRSNPSLVLTAVARLASDRRAVPAPPARSPARSHRGIARSREPPSNAFRCLRYWPMPARSAYRPRCRKPALPCGRRFRSARSTRLTSRSEVQFARRQIALRACRHISDHPGFAKPAPVALIVPRPRQGSTRSPSPACS